MNHWPALIMLIVLLVDNNPNCCADHSHTQTPSLCVSTISIEWYRYTRKRISEMHRNAGNFGLFRCMHLSIKYCSLIIINRRFIHRTFKGLLAQKQKQMQSLTVAGDRNNCYTSCCNQVACNCYRN